MLPASIIESISIHRYHFIAHHNVAYLAVLTWYETSHASAHPTFNCSSVIGARNTFKYYARSSDTDVRVDRRKLATEVHGIWVCAYSKGNCSGTDYSQPLRTILVALYIVVPDLWCIIRLLPFTYLYLTSFYLSSNSATRGWVWFWGNTLVC